MLSDSRQDPSKQVIVNVLTGFFGVLGAFLILPRAFRFFGKRFAFGIVSEIVTVVVTGLLTEKIVSRLAHEDDDASAHQQPF